MNVTKHRRQQHLSAQHYVGHPPADTSIDSSVRLVGRHFSIPMVQVNVLTDTEQVTIAAVGGPVGTRPRAGTLCTHVVREGRPRALADVQPLPSNLAHIKAYLGVPLTGREGLVIGALCVLDTVARDFGPDDVRDLQAAAAVVQDQLELMRRLGAVTHGSTTEAAELACAIRDGDIVPFFQPIVDMSTGDVTAVEALARWRHPVRGLVAPDEFIPLAEDSDIIIDLDLSILRQAAIQLGRWRTRRPALRLSVNLSTRHFDQPDFTRRLQQTMESAGADPAMVTLELTETAALTPRAAERHFLPALRRLGFRIVLDDFGSGFASIDQILRLPIDGIKLNGAVTASMGSRSGDAVVCHLNALAADLNLSTVMEGIESPHQIQQARRDGGTLGQGWVWAPAMSASDMTTYLHGSNRGESMIPAQAVRHLVERDEDTSRR